MLLLYFLGASAVLFVLDALRVAFVHRWTRGRFEVAADWHRMLSFRSSTGAFCLRQDLRVLEYRSREASGTVRFQDIERLEFRKDAEHALFQEWFLGMDLPDRWRRHRDSVEWHSIAAVARDGRTIPLFCSGKYRRREWFCGFYVEMQLVALEAVGLVADVDAQSRDALERIRAKAGYPKVVRVNDPGEFGDEGD